MGQKITKLHMAGGRVKRETEREFLQNEDLQLPNSIHLDGFTLIDDDILELVGEDASAQQNDISYDESDLIPPESIVDEKLEEKKDSNPYSSSSTSNGKRCRFCGALSGLNVELEKIGHYVCFTCLNEKRDTHNYRCLSQVSWTCELLQKLYTRDMALS